MEKEKLIEEILEKEWAYFSKLNNIGGRAACQDNREDFIIMRKSQWETFNEETLLSYLEDLNSKNNPLFQKYGQMMKYNSPQEYEKVKDILEKKLCLFIWSGKKNFSKNIQYFHLWADPCTQQKMIILKLQ